MVARSHSQSRKFGRRGRSHSKTKLGKDECAFYHEKGHWKKYCPKLKKKEKAVPDTNIAKYENAWEPSKTPSLDGKHYFVTFIDDFSRRVWVYSMTTKDEVLNVFIKWKNMVENQFDRKIKWLRIDNGGEYKSDPFFDVCNEYGIARHFTAEALEYAHHLVNRLPSLAIGGKTPMEKEESTSKKVEFEKMMINTTKKAEVPSDSPIVAGESNEEEILTQEPQQQPDSIATRKPRREIQRYDLFTNMVGYAFPVVDEDIPSNFQEATRSFPKLREWIVEESYG
ncbi:uncharacterized protein LOC120270366 [Dioscorea cayenensis subsp. rotundata]|uniref:Uncharacterized protein LOC120270366 n=1 Tax=Dioscorea cayennensis subsp. rotundata TaxID=55577 RepID=A0AB40C0K9_DIOCR|nr:uncharacterized protein LOC120270366 [Dioscorea cayenensis subsp. rotundata]